MLVIHGVWAYGVLLLWAEDSRNSSASSAARERQGTAESPDRAAVKDAALQGAALQGAVPKGTGAAKGNAVQDAAVRRAAGAGAATPVRRASRTPRPHPFAAAPGLLAEAISAAAGPMAADLIGQADDDELILWLPAAAGRPIASPELADDTPGTPGPAAGRRVLSGWRVPALAVAPTAAAAILAALTQRDPIAGADPPAVTGADPAAVAGAGPAAVGGADPAAVGGADPAVIGGSLRYLAALAALAADLTARGRVLPALVSNDDDGSYAARWRPVLAGSDAQRAQELAAAMPPLCRATEPSGTSSALVLTEVLEALADAAARARLAPGPLLPARRGRRPSATSLAERWAAALTSADGIIAGASEDDEPEAQRLAADLAAWHRAAQRPAGPVRACFRLIEPPSPEPPEPSASPGLTEPAGPAEPAGSESAEQAASADEWSAEQAASADEWSAEQAASADEWTVELALQATDDPSLLLPAADIWSGATSGGWASAGIKHPEDELLAGLGAAARLFPELTGALRARAPDEVGLTADGAYRFLTQTAPLLSGAGFGVLLPDWVRRARLGLKLTTRSQQTAGASVTESRFGLNDLVNFRYELAVGGEPLSQDELAELARLKVPLVRLRGRWVELDETHLKAALRFLERDQAGSMTAADALLAGLGQAGDTGLPVEQVDADGWLADLLSGETDRRLAPVATPADFRGELRPYQERGLAWLSFLGDLGLGAVLADDMGLGKGVQMISLLARERNERQNEDLARNREAGPAAGRGPTLMVCPMSLVGNWQREAERFTPGLHVYVHHGADRLTGDDLLQELVKADLVITTYGVAARDQQQLAQVRWARVVCDEAQNIKNAATRQARAVRALPAGARVALTGTPVENRLSDLWSIMEFTSPGLLGPAERFRTKFAVPIERNGDETAAQRLRQVTGPFILRRLKTDKAIISDLPDKLEMKVWCNLTPEQATLYQATVADMMAKIEAATEPIERRGLVLATMAKLKQACNHPAHLLGDGSRLAGRSGKLARLEEICDEVVAAGEKALCFTQYAEFGRMLQPYLAARLSVPVRYLHGGTPKKQRDAMVAAFQEEADPAIFLLSLKAGGTGLNLTAASHVIHVDRWWNPAVEDQATDRAFRIGQRRDVQVRKFVCVGTLEERIDAMIEEKKALAERIVGTGESWLAELSVAQLRDVVALSPDAVAA